MYLSMEYRVQRQSQLFYTNTRLIPSLLPSISVNTKEPGNMTRQTLQRAQLIPRSQETWLDRQYSKELSWYQGARKHD